MSWDSLPEEMRLFAVELRKDTATELTGQSLLSIYGALDYKWRTQRTMKTDSPLPIPPPRDKGLHPERCKVHAAHLSFRFVLGPRFDQDKLPAVTELQVRVEGLADYEHCVVQLEDHWRVDTHAFKETPREPHPLIHFQRGGYEQDAWARRPNYVPGRALPALSSNYWDGLLQSPGPRIPMPPLCPMLAIDFVIAQHDGTIWGRLRDNPEYRQLIRASQRRLWDPLFDALSNTEIRQRWLGPIAI